MKRLQWILDWDGEYDTQPEEIEDYCDKVWYPMCDEVFYRKKEADEQFFIQPDELVEIIYRDLYNNAYPKRGYDWLYEHSPWGTDSDGEFVPHPEAKKMTNEERWAHGFKPYINFMAYYIPQNVYNQIVEKHVRRKYHMISDYDLRCVRNTVALGCSPTCNGRDHAKRMIEEEKRLAEWERI